MLAVGTTTTWPPSIYVEDYYAPNGLKAITVYGQLQGEGAYLSYYSYDSMNRLESVIHRRSSGWARFAGMEYVSRDEAGNPSEVREYYGGGASDYYTSTYTYDNANRLTGWSLNGTPRGAWTYDQVGNWTMNDWVTDDLVDRLDESPTDTFAYHPNGALKQSPGTGTPAEAFGYNDQDLMSVKTDMGQSLVSQMTWDYAGRRVALSASGGDTWQFIYDPTASVPSVLAEVKNGTVEAFYVREPGGELLARVAGQTRQYYFFDGLGSTQAICPASEGNPTDRYFHTPWGEPDARNETLSGTPGNPYRYVGQLGYYTHHQDANLSDWMQLGVRFYQPEIGRFERRDPVVDPGGVPYEYASSDPLRRADPSGYSAQLLPVLPVVGGAAVAAYLYFRVKPCLARAMSEAVQLHGYDDKLAHCYYACRANRCFDVFRFSVGFPLAEEIVGAVIERFFSDNSPGDAGAQTVGLACAYTGRSCTDCCRCAVQTLRSHNPRKYRPE